MHTSSFYALSIAFLLIGGTNEAQANEGSFFLQACGAAVRESGGANLNSDEVMGSIYGTGYVAGFLDSMSVTSSVMKGPKPVCLPEEGISNDQAIRIFVKYLRQNPEILHQSGRMSLMISLKNAFPCAE